MPRSSGVQTSMPFSSSKYMKFRSGMHKRIGSLRSKTEDSMDVAVDTMMEERVDSYFRVEQGLDEIIESLFQIEEELEQICDLSGAMRLESRLEFVPPVFDEFQPRFQAHGSGQIADLLELFLNLEQGLDNLVESLLDSKVAIDTLLHHCIDGDIHAVFSLRAQGPDSFVHAASELHVLTGGKGHRRLHSRGSGHCSIGPQWR